MRNHFEQQLTYLHTELIRMGSLCEQAINAAVTALLNADKTLAAQISPIEKAIDQKERDIESLCMKLLMQQQPVARDLRQISAALKMITDLERIGDQAEDIAEIIGYLDGRRADEFELMEQMASAAIKMVTESLDAFVQQDVTIAHDVILRDDYVDGKFNEIKQSLIKMINEKLEDGEYALDVLMIAKYFERIGDHATNVAEWVVYAITGIHNGEREQ